MRGMSKVIIAATLLMVVSLALILGLVLVLLAELYCSLLLRQRKFQKMSSSTPIPTTPAVTTTPIESISQLLDQSTSSPLGSFGVIRAPRNFLFPSVSSSDKFDLEKPHCQVPHSRESQTRKPHFSTPLIELLSTSLPSSPPFLPAASPKALVLRTRILPGRAMERVDRCSFDWESEESDSEFQFCDHEIVKESLCGRVKTRSMPPALTQPVKKLPLHASNGVLSGVTKEHFMYISNPIYDNEARRPSTPFETPDTLPSCLEAGESSGSDEEIRCISPSSSPSFSLPLLPPLTPMKKLPAESCSVSLRVDSRFLGTSSSDSNTNENCNGVSSSSSGSPCNSLSW